MEPFTQDAINIIQAIPAGKVVTYGLVARLAGAPKAARQVARLLHSMSGNHDLPWHRVISSKGFISLPSIDGKDNQKWLLEQEGVGVSDDYEIDLRTYLWDVDKFHFSDDT